MYWTENMSAVGNLLGSWHTDLVAYAGLADAGGTDDDQLNRAHSNQFAQSS